MVLFSVKSSYLSNSERVESSQGNIVIQWTPPSLLKVENEDYWKRLQEKSKNHHILLVQLPGAQFAKNLEPRSLSFCETANMISHVMILCVTKVMF